MSKHYLNIWGREFLLDVEYNCYNDDESDVTNIQKEAKNKFLANPDILNKSLDEVKKYCTNKNPNEIGTDSINNIFKYVKPKSIAIANNREGNRVIALMCTYKFDLDLGIAVVYQNEELREVNNQDVIL